MAMTPEQRSAQRRVSGILGHSGELRPEGFRIWRDRRCEEWDSGDHEVAEGLKALGVPYTVEPARRLGRDGCYVRVAREHLPALARWIPLVRAALEAEAARGPRSGCDAPLGRGRRVASRRPA